jgi:hypothetical protein
MRKRGWRDPSSEGLERDAGGAGGLSKSIEYEPTRAGKKIFKKKRLAELSNLGDAKRLRVQDK